MGKEIHEKTQIFEFNDNHLAQEKSIPSEMFLPQLDEGKRKLKEKRPKNKF